MKFLKKYKDNTLRLFIIFITVYVSIISGIPLFKAALTNKLTIDDAGRDASGIISIVYPGGSAEKAGIKPGDKILSINGREFNSLTSFHDELSSTPADGYAVYKIQRGNEVFEAKVYPHRYFHLIFFVFSALGFGFLLNGFFVGFSKPKEIIPQIFFLMSAAAGLTFNLLGGVTHYVDGASYMYWNYLIASALFFPMFFHFFSIYPLKYDWSRRRLKIFSVYVYAILLDVFLMSGFGESIAKSNMILDLILGYSPLIFLLLGLGLFIRSFLKVKDKELRKPLKILVLGLIIGFLGLLYYFGVFPFIISKAGMNPLYRLPVALVLAIPAAFGYSIYKYRILDTEFIIKRGLVFGFVTTSIIIAYLFIVSIMETLLDYYKLGNKQIVTIAAIIAIIFTFSYVNKIVRTFVDRRFFRVRYNYRKALLSFSNELPYLNDINQVIEKLAGTIKETIGVTEMKVWVCDNKYRGLTDGQKSELIELCAPEDSSEESSEDTVSLSGGMPENPDETGGNGNKRARIITGEVYKALFEKDKSPKVLFDINLMEMSIPQEYKNFIRDEKIVLSIPLLIKDEMIGTINFGDKPGGSVYSDEDIDLLKTIASQTSVVFENARLRAEEFKKNSIEEELIIARNIQTGLLPENNYDFGNLEISAVTQPARIVGGDFYDVLNLGGGKVLVVIADVSGKGIPAALYMAKVQALIRFASRIFHTPKEILTEVNRHVYEKFEKNAFVTVVLALFDLNENNVRMTRAGHNPVIFSRN
ncbi:MAG: SpoIIE family protein phosphatase, partial [Ignavibacteriae bacterium]|nr:SpoIIE family protein phosphatase [Ignavibacteriota bacterium]